MSEKFSVKRTKELLDLDAEDADICATCGGRWANHFGKECAYPSDARKFQPVSVAMQAQLSAALTVIEKQRTALVNVRANLGEMLMGKVHINLVYAHIDEALNLIEAT